MSIKDELRSLAYSPFAKQKADLMILGIPDSSGVPVVDRMNDIRHEHEEAQYRLVSKETLEQAIAELDAAYESQRDLMRLLSEFQANTPREMWPEQLRRAAALIDARHTPEDVPKVRRQ